MLSVEDDVCVGGVTGVKPGGSQLGHSSPVWLGRNQSTGSDKLG